MSDTHTNSMHTEDDASQRKSDVAQREEDVLAFWNEKEIFKKALEKEAPNGDFVFYDGPPFATGLPHYGHLLQGTIKDAIPRFWTMSGYRVRRKWGWDCHGLPLENIIEKRLGLATKRDIEAYGIQNFNEAAREAVLEYADEWKRIVPRMGRWVDMEDDYKTMDPSYTESVWWVFSQLHKKGLVYEGFKSMHLCPRCGTTLSNFEVNLGYKDIKDIAVTVKLPLVDEPDTSLLVWTTTPWTLPGNMAAAVHKEYDYVKVRVTTDAGEENVILAKARLSQLGTDEYEIVDEFKGADLVGKSYTPPFNYLEQALQDGRIIINHKTDGQLDAESIKKYAWKIFHADYVELGDEGTGAVHLAPAYGEEDMRLAQEQGVPIVHHVDPDGHFMEHIAEFAGQLVKPKDDDDAQVTHLDADIEILKHLKEKELLFKKENITHSYPHCWRCDTPLLNYATTSWFVNVVKIKDELVAQNSTVHWVPEHVGTNRFGKWLEGARDWAISRQRYWGAPLPIWRNPVTKEYKIFGSLKELQEYVPKSGNTYMLMRHGESELNTRNTLNYDEGVENGLTETGRKQAQQAAESIKDEHVDFIYYSPLQRTRETAHIMAEVLGVPKDRLIADPRILEIAFGEFEGRPVDEYHAFYKNGMERLQIKPEGGESWNEVRSRTGEFLYEIDRTHQNARILIVAHNGTLQMLQAALHGDSAEKAAAHIDDNSYDLQNAEVRSLSLVRLPHNDNYELDFHRPYIDHVELIDTDGTPLIRVPDVFDCWFESGSMPYAETHYPFENLDVANPEEGVRFPADFIAESIDQTRGWFYSLMVLGVALYGKSPYQNVITNGLVLAEDGKKMSKSLQNYPDPMELVAQYGADSMRYYLLSSPIIRGEDLNFSEKGVMELQRKNIGRLHNVLAMYELYADDTSATSDSPHVLDRWIVARMHQLTAEVTEGFTQYELDRATRPITDFIDDLSVWYLRRSRDRLKGDDAQDKQRALGTLRYILQQLSLVLAPSMPFYAEYLYGRVKADDAAESVHLEAWPVIGNIDEEVIVNMETARSIVEAGLHVRALKKIKSRQPLQEATYQIEVKRPQLTEEYEEIVRDEVNLKALKSKEVNYPASGGPVDDGEVVTVSVGGIRLGLNYKITPELQAEGDARELMRQIQDMRKKGGLEAKDRVTLTIQTSDGGEALVQQFEDEIKKVTGADTIAFGDAQGDEITAGVHSFTIGLHKN